MQALESLLKTRSVREAILYKKLRGFKVKCGICERHCIIDSGKKGDCKTRLNINGVLLTLVYGDISSLESRPIETEQFFHYWPGSTALTFSTWSCNFDCPWCNNHRISNAQPNPWKSSHFFPQEQVLKIALHNGDNGLCGSFQEPTVLTDWASHLFEQGRLKGLYSCYVSNGYMTPEVLKLLKRAGMNGVRIDVKGDKETYKKYFGGVNVEKVWKNAREAKKIGFHVEISNLVITDVNDDEECLRWIIKHHLKAVGPRTPLHFIRYYPAHKFSNSSTKYKTLEKAYEMAKKEGVLYPYLGNVEDHTYTNTHCPKCGQLLIQRLGYTIIKYNITEVKKCPKCGQLIPIVGKRIRKWRTLN